MRFVINADSVGARCGSTVIYQTGGEDLARWLRRQTRRIAAAIKPTIEELRPFSDHFPFNCRGVPSLWFSRQTVTAGRHYHHTVPNALDAVSFNYLAELAGFLARWRQNSRRASSLFRFGVLAEMAQGDYRGTQT